MHFIFRKFILICFLWRSWHSTYFWWNVYPLKPKNCPYLPRVKMLPLVSHGANLFNMYPFRDSIALYVQTLFPIGPAVWPHFSMFWVVDDPLKPPEMPPGYWGANCIWPIPFPDESADVYQIGCQSVKPFDSFPKLLNMWPPTPPPPRIAHGVL